MAHADRRCRLFNRQNLRCVRRRQRQRARHVLRALVRILQENKARLLRGGRGLEGLWRRGELSGKLCLGNMELLV